MVYKLSLLLKDIIKDTGYLYNEKMRNFEHRDIQQLKRY